jgi:hypothetical protein
VDFAVDERFVFAVQDPGEESGKTTRHVVDAESAHSALSIHAIATSARLLGITQRPDGSLGGTCWRGERLFRINVAPINDES